MKSVALVAHPVRGLRAAALAIWLGLATQCWAQSGNEQTLEYSVKAVYLLKFGAFVEWPPGRMPAPNEPFGIGVLGGDPFGPTLDQYAASHNVQGRPIRIKRFAAPAQVQDVHILFIAQSERQRMAEIAAAAHGANILTVADADTALAAINFVVDNDRVRFDVNLEQAELAGLRISSKLLSVARSVKNGRGQRP